MKAKSPLRAKIIFFFYVTALVVLPKKFATFEDLLTPFSYASENEHLRRKTKIKGLEMT